jgi:hypothetical protein
MVAHSVSSDDVTGPMALVRVSYYSRSTGDCRQIGETNVGFAGERPLFAILGLSVPMTVKSNQPYPSSRTSVILSRPSDILKKKKRYTHEHLMGASAGLYYYGTHSD